MADLTPLLDDLRAESADLDALVADLDLAGLATPTPAPGWTIAHQLAHLAWTDQWSLLAAREPDKFPDAMREAFTAGSDPIEDGAAEGVGEAPAALLGRWRAGRADLLDALRAAAAADLRLPWFGPPMKAASMATARIMETWAHGQDVADALGVARVPTARIRQVAHLGVRTMGFAFALHGLALPEAPVRVELTGPAGEAWTWGPEDAADRVSGPALDFCLLVTQRRALDALALHAEGEAALAWLPIAQAFAGPPGAGR
ncbi:TIGR03084 family metal-binding protein [Kitasatospora sp. MAP5-34]|uniref:TIGR03084 family metal-binding protein n=1 Tax=Kitasatospora sp. MAP5-34 TaxID=3035102 RepID=UPI002476CF72|nr:TIGR03084 family metal-binding protein [Kitasatospora sp. MAP5-34]